MLVQLFQIFVQSFAHFRIFFATGTAGLSRRGERHRRLTRATVTVVVGGIRHFILCWSSFCICCWTGFLFTHCYFLNKLWGQFDAPYRFPFFAVSFSLPTRLIKFLSRVPSLFLGWLLKRFRVRFLLSRNGEGRNNYPSLSQLSTRPRTQNVFFYFVFVGRLKLETALYSFFASPQQTPENRTRKHSAPNSEWLSKKVSLRQILLGV